MTDARTTNWRFLLPSEPEAGLLLPVDGQRLGEAVSVCSRRLPDLAAACAVRHPAVLAPDLSGWATDCGLDGAALLRALAGATAPGGYLYAGFANAGYPARRGRRGRLTLPRARRVLRRCGLEVREVYVALPSHRLPALLAPAHGPELRYVLAHQVFPFSDSRSRWTGPLRVAGLRLMRALALAAPARLRARLAPAYAVVAVRTEVGST